MSIFVNAFFTATISSSTMTVSAVSEGTLAIGMAVTGLNVPTNTVITALGTGTGGAGTYIISTSATISSQSMMAEFILPPNTKIVSQSSSTVFNLSASVSASFTASFSSTTMTVTAISAGTLDIGQIVTGTSVTANSVIIAFGTGAGGVGTYTLSQTSILTGVSCTATKTIASKQIQGWKSGTEWIVSASSSVGPIPITASTVGYQHKKAASGTPALTNAAALSYFLGPSTGGGAFSVTVPLADGETSVPQKVLSFVRLLVSKYKPAGIPYTIN
jgi:pyruvate/2-oxoglutarate dehydrogenase complex dihydrolipoamide acyltransferase (E2) component